MQDAIAQVRENYQFRQDLVQQSTAMTNRVKAVCRRVCDGDKERGNQLYTAITRGHEHPLADVVSLSALPLLEARAALDQHIAALDKTLERIAKKLPIAGYVEEVRGFSYGSLAKIVGEAGDLSNYPNPDKLKKRMGLAQYKGRSGKQWRTQGGLTKGEWMEFGYSPRRRSVMYVIGDNLIRARNPHYYPMYLNRKAYEEKKAPDLGRGWHTRAHRYMEQQFLIDLWRAWRDVVSAEAA
jgi:hypothetical protein